MGEVTAGDEVAGRYRLVRLLGSGGHGEVWEAASLTVSTLRVALKRVRHEGDDGSRAVQEAEALAKVRHPHVVPVHDVVTEGDDRWIVMGHVAGEPLAALGRISVEQAATYGAQLADGLAAVHAQGLLHRDVTPSNVLVANGSAILIDFGIAHDVAQAVTVTGSSGTGADDDPDGADGPGAARVSGTPGYLAPEMFVPGTQFRRPADVFALGATLYRALEGVAPFDATGGTSGSRAERAALRPPRRSGAMAPVLLRMLHEEPRRRPDLEDVRDDLRALLAGDGPGLNGAASRRTRWLRGLAVAACVVVLAGAVAPYAWRAYGPGADGDEPVAAGTGPDRAGRIASPDPTPTPPSASPTPSAEPAVRTPTPRPSPSRSAPAPTRGTGTGTDEPASGTPLTFPAKNAQAAREASWDPCRLLSPGALRGFGTVRTDSDRAGFPTCHATVADGGAVSEVELTMYVDEDPDGSGTEQGGGVTLYSSSGAGECSREVVFGDDGRYNLSFEARSVQGSGPDPCDLADAVAGPAADRAAEGDLPVRTALPMAGSVIGRSTCDLPSPDALRASLNIDDLVSPQREFAEWDCTWDGDDSRYLRLLFERNEGYERDGTRIELSGHVAYERGDAWGEGCLVDVVAGQGPSPEGDGTVTELLRVHLTGESDHDVLCEDAVAVARSAAERL